MLLDMRNTFWSEVAKEACLLLYPTNDCETVVNVYMPPPDFSINSHQTLIAQFSTIEEVLEEKELNKTILVYKIKRKFPHIFKSELEDGINFDNVTEKNESRIHNTSEKSKV